MAANDHLGAQFGTASGPSSKPSCATCGKKRKLTTYSSLDKWGGEPDQCMGCGSKVQHWATKEAPASGPAPFTDADWIV